MANRVTIRDVAKLADVSVATVSAVINKNKYVSQELEQRVHQAVEQLGYRPNLVARSLNLYQHYQPNLATLGAWRSKNSPASRL